MDEQKAKFMGGTGQIYNIGQKSFPYNVWKPVSAKELEHLIESGMYHRFTFDPVLDFSINAKELKPEKPKKEGKK